MTKLRKSVTIEPFSRGWDLENSDLEPVYIEMPIYGKSIRFTQRVEDDDVAGTTEYVFTLNDTELRRFTAGAITMLTRLLEDDKGDRLQHSDSALRKLADNITNYLDAKVGA